MSNINKLIQEGIITGSLKLIAAGSILLMLKKYINGETDFAELPDGLKKVLNNAGEKARDTMEQGASAAHEVTKGLLQKSSSSSSFNINDMVQNNLKHHI